MSNWSSVSGDAPSAAQNAPQTPSAAQRSARSEAASARTERRVDEAKRMRALLAAHAPIDDDEDEDAPRAREVAVLADGTRAFTLYRGAFPAELGAALAAELGERAQGVARRRVMGSDVPRVELFYSREAGREYVFSRRTYRADAEASPAMLSALDWANALAASEGYRGDALEDVLVNVYAKVSDGVTAHADDEPTIDQSQPIVSVSLGTAWRFVIKRARKNADGTTQSIELVLRDGDVVVMHPGAQAEYTHEVPKRLKVPALGYTPDQLQLDVPRVNLTFRAYLRPGPRAESNE